MSRAIRRQQIAAPKERPEPRRILGPRQQRVTRGAKPPQQARRRLRLGRPGWLDDIISELKKVTWPTRDETAYLTMVVVVISIIVGTALGIIDIFFSWLIDQLLLS